MLFPGDAGDGSLIIFLLEHSWKWINAPLSYSLWDAPFYFPTMGTAAHSDLLAGVGPVFWAARLLGADIPTAATIWFLGQLSLNAIAAVWLFRGGSGFSPLASAIGAVIVVAANPMQNQFFHPQMIPLYYGIFAAGCLVRFIRLGDQLTRRQSFSLLLLAGLAFTMQMYSAFYIAWFLVLVSGITLVISLVYSRTRALVLQRTKGNWKSVITAGSITVIALTPWALHYLPASQSSPTPTADMIYGWIPRWYSWLYMGPLNRWYDWSLDFQYFQWLPPNEAHEHRIGVGLATLLVSFIGFGLTWRKPWPRVLLILSGTLLVLVTIAPGGVNIWSHIFTYIPGAPAVRTVTRIAIPLTILLSFGAVIFAHRMIRSRFWMVAILIAIPLGLEGSSRYPTFDVEPMLVHARATASDLETKENCTSFLFVPDPDDHRPAYIKQQSALWIAHESGLPTVNGYGHFIPEEWNFGDPVMNGQLSGEEIDERIEHWETTHEESAPICIVN